MMSKKLTFEELEVGDHFISFPSDGDDKGHGGYRGAHRLFIKTSIAGAKDGRGVTSTFPLGMVVVKVMLG